MKGKALAIALPESAFSFPFPAGLALPGCRSRPRAASVPARSRRRRDFRVGGILNAAMAQTVQNVTLSLTLPITCHICLGKVMRDPGRSLPNGIGCEVARGSRGISVRGRDRARGVETPTRLLLLRWEAVTWGKEGARRD